MWWINGTTVMKNVILSNRAVAAMVSGIEKFPDTENGGILLGIRRKGEIAVVEAIEAGEAAIHERGKLVCNIKSMEYIANTVKWLYEEELEVIGIWHKHNHDYIPAFSTEDNLCHKKVCDSLKKDIISILFQKNKDDEYIMRVFRYCLKHQFIEEEFEVKDLMEMISYRVW